MTYKHVLTRISDLTTVVDVEANKARLIRLIRHNAIVSMSVSSLIQKSAVPVQIENGIGELPCDLWRLLRANVPIRNNTYKKGYYNGNRVRNAMEPNNLQVLNSYGHDGQYIKPSNMRSGTIYISYLAVPMIEVTDDGNTFMDVAIHPDSLDYCAYESAHTVLLDMVARGEIDPYIEQKFEQRSGWAINVATGSTNKLSIDDVEGMAFMLRNAQFFNLR